MRRKIVRGMLALAALLGVAALAGGFWVRGQYVGSLPQIDGEVVGSKVASPVAIERDRLGIPTIKAENPTDLAYAVGFTHAQERFFQMDLLRRNAAGELSELVGKAALPMDKRSRLHRFRARASKVVENCTPAQRATLAAYVQGVNAGLATLSKMPFEYQLLQVVPKPWQAEDSLLVQYSMFLDLQLDLLFLERSLCLLRDTLPPPMFDFLAPRGTEWDAPLDGSKLPVAALPGPDVVNLRKVAPEPKQLTNRRNHHPIVDIADWRAGNAVFDDQIPVMDSVRLGSNSWALSGKRTAHGGAIVCDDMHLRFGVPHIWYRAALEWKDAAGKHLNASGVTLPGTSAIVVGSNNKVAWAFTNSEADWSDLVVVEVDPANPKLYRTPKGSTAFETVVEDIVVQGGPNEKFSIVETIWGPIVGQDGKGRPLAQRWVAHEVEGVNLHFADMQAVQSLEEALELANRSGIPGQNFVVGDANGRIAWTIAGRLPKRFGHDGRLPVSWADGKAGWSGFRGPAEYPRVVDPAGGQIWTANARVVGGPGLETLGFGNYDLGARAGQIRDDLEPLQKASEVDMLKVHLDDRAVFLTRWQKLLVDTLTSEAVKNNPRRAEIKKFVESWGAKASVDSVGFRLVREFRIRVADLAMKPLTQPVLKIDPSFHYARAGQSEGPLWRLIEKRPLHLLDPRFSDWSGLLLAAVDDVAKSAFAGREHLDGYTHGAFNRLVARHPLSVAVPALNSLATLDMPAESLAGDSAHMPRIQSPTHGASQRMAVSPGKESQGYMHMPCGQCGHPASPHYNDMHGDWAAGRPTPYLPGEPTHKLQLKP